MRTIKPNYAERRIVRDLIEEGENEDNEEKKMEESTAVSTGDSADSSNAIPLSAKESESMDSVMNDEAATTVNETISTDASDTHASVNNNDSNENAEEDDNNIDVTSTDTVSLFTRLLSISNKAGAPSGTVTMNMPPTAGASNPNDDDENQVITPTIMQNGRPVSSTALFLNIFVLTDKIS